MAFKSVTVTHSYQQVAQQVQDAIRSGALVRGQRLPTERELGESFGVSRSVVREAVKVLAAMGLVESRQGSGTYVCDNPVPWISRALTLSVAAEERSVLSLFEFREALEVLAAGRAAERRSEAAAAAIRRAATLSAEAAAANDIDAFGEADTRFHGAIGDAAGNPYVIAVLSAVRGMQSDVARLISERIAGSITIAAGQHARIAEAIAAGAADAAADAMVEHVRYTANAVRDILEAAAYA